MSNLNNHDIPKTNHLNTSVTSNQSKDSNLSQDIEKISTNIDDNIRAINSLISYLPSDILLHVLPDFLSINETVKKNSNDKDLPEKNENNSSVPNETKTESNSNDENFTNQDINKSKNCLSLSEEIESISSIINNNNILINSLVSLIPPEFLPDIPDFQSISDNIKQDTSSKSQSSINKSVNSNESNLNEFNSAITDSDPKKKPNPKLTIRSNSIRKIEFLPSNDIYPKQMETETKNKQMSLYSNKKNSIQKPRNKNLSISFHKRIQFLNFSNKQQSKKQKQNNSPFSMITSVSVEPNLKSIEKVNHFTLTEIIVNADIFQWNFSNLSQMVDNPPYQLSGIIGRIDIVDGMNKSNEIDENKENDKKSNENDLKNNEEENKTVIENVYITRNIEITADFKQKEHEIINSIDEKSESKSNNKTEEEIDSKSNDKIEEEIDSKSNDKKEEEEIDSKTNNKKDEEEIDSKSNDKTEEEENDCKPNDKKEEEEIDSKSNDKKEKIESLLNNMKEDNDVDISHSTDKLEKEETEISYINDETKNITEDETNENINNIIIEEEEEVVDEADENRFDLKPTENQEEENREYQIVPFTSNDHEESALNIYGRHGEDENEAISNYQIVKHHESMHEEKNDEGTVFRTVTKSVVVTHQESHEHQKRKSFNFDDADVEADNINNNFLVGDRYDLSNFLNDSSSKITVVKNQTKTINMNYTQKINIKINDDYFDESS